MKTLLLAAASLLMSCPAAVSAAMVTDAVGDFLPGFVGPNLPDLDVTSFSVDLNPSTNIFSLGVTFAGTITPGTPGFYVIGVNTGTGSIRPFANVGQPNVIFNQALVIQKNGTGTLGQTALDPNAITIAGNILTLKLPATVFTSTGFTPGHYGFNIWPRVGLSNNNQISDFSPENATLAAVPEPKVWASLLFGFGVVGGALRRRPKLRLQAA